VNPLGAPTSASLGGRFRVVVCGAVFGQVYLEALSRTDPRIELAGLLARGSARSASCADHYGVPLYRDVGDIPDDVDAACVVVRGALLGGRGTELGHALLRRGLHVLQEHPVHPKELVESLRIARQCRRQYHLNAFYSKVAPVRRFIGAARALRTHGTPLFVDAACGCQLSYSLLDILGHVLGGLTPWSLEPLPRAPDETFTVVRGTIARVPVTLRVQNQLDPSDPDGYSHFLHRVDVTTEAGTLRLVDTHGPVVWVPRPQFPREVRALNARPQFAGAAGEQRRTTVLGPPESPSFDEIFRGLWSDGVVRAVLNLRDAAAHGENALAAAQSQLTVCELWQHLLSQIGPPELVSEGRGGRPSAPPAIEALGAAAERMAARA
jgi:thiazolinyl imide reductase